MSSLSDRIKSALHGPQSDSATQGDADSHIPGSFPTDDMAPGDAQRAQVSESDHQSQERSRLHKANDPRGHAHPGSGVGGVVSSGEPAATREPVEEAYAPAEGFEKREEHARRNEAAGFGDEQPGKEDTTQHGTDARHLGTTAGTNVLSGAEDRDAGSEHNVVRSGAQSSTVDHKDPYWGDVSQGHGIYNTVTGHGSGQDEARRRQTTSADQQQTPDSSGHRAFPLVTERGREHGQDAAATTTTTTSTTTSTATRQQPEDQTQHGSSRWGEGAAGAGIAGAAGTAAYTATRGDDDAQRTRHETTAEPASEDKEKKRGGGLFGLFHRDSKDDDDKTKEHRSHGEGKLHKDHKAAPAAAAAAGAYQRDDGRSEERRRGEQTYEEGRRSGKAGDPAVAAAALAFNKHGDDGSAVPRETTTSSSGLGSDATSRGTHDAYQSFPSSTAPGTRSENTTGGFDDRSASNRNAAVLGTGAAVAGLGAGGYAAREHGKDRRADDGNSDRLNRDTRADDSSRSAGWFAAPIGTGAVDAARSAEPSQQSTYTAADSSRQTGTYGAAPATTGSSTLGGTGVGPYSSEASRSGTAPTAGAAGLAGADSAAPGGTGYTGSSANPQSAREPALREPSAELPRLTDEANQGRYNLLSSGTPSGVAVEPSQTDSSPRAAADTSSSNRGAVTTAAGLAAVGAGAGAATYGSRRHDDDNDGSAERKLGRGTDDSTATKGFAGQGSSAPQKVIHACVKCGEENDISKYFTSDRQRRA